MTRVVGRYFDEGRSMPNPWLWAKWQAASKLAFSNIKNLLGGRVHFAVTGGAALSHTVQEFFDDIGVPIVEVGSTRVQARWRVCARR